MTTAITSNKKATAKTANPTTVSIDTDETSYPITYNTIAIWFYKGFESGTLEDGDTFNTDDL